MANYLYGIICEQYGAERPSAIKVNLDTFLLDSTLEIDHPAFEGSINPCAIISGDYMYVAHGIVVGDFKVIKILLATMAYVDEITVTGIGEIPLSMVVNNGFLYIGCGDAGWGVIAHIAKVNLSTFTFDSEILVGEEEHYDMVVVGNTLYTASQTHTYKIDLATFTEVDSVEFWDGDADVRSICTDNTYLYYGDYDYPEVDRVDIATFTWNEATDVCDVTVAEITAVDISGSYLYATTLDGSPDLMKVDLTTFAEVDTLNVTYYDARDLFISGGYLYMGMFWLPGSPVIDKVNLSTFTQDSDLQIPGYPDYRVWHLAGVSEEVPIVGRGSGSLAGVLELLT